MKIANWKAPIYNVSGLAFDKTEVRLRVGQLKEWSERDQRVVFAARFDQEKQPDFFMDIAEQLAPTGIEFALVQGGPLRSNNQKYVDRARNLETRGLLKIYENQKKNDYYEILNSSKVMFNCALQDWTSNTVSEADALNCNVLFPAYRSFPEIFANCHERMYVPWSKDDAINKLQKLLVQPHKDMGKISDWTSSTIDRYVDIMMGNGEQWRRDTNRYRDYVAERKY